MGAFCLQLTSQGSAATYLRCGVGNITSFCDTFHTLSSSERTFESGYGLTKLRADYKVKRFLDTVYVHY